LLALGITSQINSWLQVLWQGIVFCIVPRSSWGGGIAYLYRKKIKDFVTQNRWLWLCACIVLSVVWFITPGDDVGIIVVKNLALFFSWLMYGISVKSKILSNKVTKYMSGISLELYLAQMVIFRVIEKVGLLYKLGYGWGGFLTIWFIEILGLIVFVEVWGKIERIFSKAWV